jgi:hypothetical protein
VQDDSPRILAKLLAFFLVGVIILTCFATFAVTITLAIFLAQVRQPIEVHVDHLPP